MAKHIKCNQIAFKKCLFVGPFVAGFARVCTDSLVSSLTLFLFSYFIYKLHTTRITKNKQNSVLHTVQRWWSVAQFFFSQRTKETKRWHCLPVCVVTNLSPGPSFCRASDACDASQLSCVNWAGKGGEREKKHNTLTYKKMTFCFVNAEKS